MSHANRNVRFREWISQVVNAVQPKLLVIVKDYLEERLVQLRDEQIGNSRYERNCSFKRYGFRIRKYITCTIGRLENVRIPRIRAIDGEIRMFTDRFVHFLVEMPSA